MNDDFDGLESALQSRHTAPDDFGARARILCAVKRELHLTRHRKPTDFWRFAAGLAAALLLGVNLAMSAGDNTGWDMAHSRQASAPSLRQSLHEILNSDH